MVGRVDETKTEASAKPLPLDPDLAAALLDWRRLPTPVTRILCLPPTSAGHADKV